MNTAKQKSEAVADPSRAEGVCRVAMFYDDTAARDRAVTLSHHLVDHFWHELDFAFSWWRFRYLADPVVAETASMAAVGADVLVFSAAAATPPESYVLRWLSSWVPQRQEQAGVLVPLLYPSTAEALSDSTWMVEIEEVARQTGLECLLPRQLKRSPLLDEPLRQLQVRTRHIGGILGEIMDDPHGLEHRPPSWGLNE